MVKYTYIIFIGRYVNVGALRSTIDRIVPRMTLIITLHKSSANPKVLPTALATPDRSKMLNNSGTVEGMGLRSAA